MNPASRLLALAKTAASNKAAQNDRANAKWMTVLRQPGDPEKLNDTTVPRRLVKVLDQVDDLEGILSDMAIDSTLYHNDLVKVRNAFSPSRMGDQWANVIGQLSPEVIKSLAWQAWVIKSREEPVDEIALKELQQRISELTAMLDESIGLPDRLTVQIRRQLQALEESLKDYAITGIDPISKEIKNSVVDIVENGDAIRDALATADPKDKGVLQGFAQIVLKGNEILQSTGKPAAAINSLIALGKEVFKMLTE